MVKLGILAFGLLGGVVAYAHVTDNMRLSHETGIVVGLLTGVLVVAGLAFWLLENDDALRNASHWNSKHRR